MWFGTTNNKKAPLVLVRPVEIPAKPVPAVERSWPHSAMLGSSTALPLFIAGLFLYMLYAANRASKKVRKMSRVNISIAGQALLFACLCLLVATKADLPGRLRTTHSTCIHAKVSSQWKCKAGAGWLACLFAKTKNYIRNNTNVTGQPWEVAIG